MLGYAASTLLDCKERLVGTAQEPDLLTHDLLGAGAANCVDNVWCPSDKAPFFLFASDWEAQMSVALAAMVPVAMLGMKHLRRRALDPTLALDDTSYPMSADFLSPEPSLYLSKRKERPSELGSSPDFSPPSTGLNMRASASPRGGRNELRPLTPRETRQLQGERDAALTQLDASVSERDAAVVARDAAVRELAAITRQRDEARSKVSESAAAVAAAAEVAEADRAHIYKAYEKADKESRQLQTSLETMRDQVFHLSAEAEAAKCEAQTQAAVATAAQTARDALLKERALLSRELDDARAAPPTPPSLIWAAVRDATKAAAAEKKAAVEAARAEQNSYYAEASDTLLQAATLLEDGLTQARGVLLDGLATGGGGKGQGLPPSGRCAREEEGGAEAAAAAMRWYSQACSQVDMDPSFSQASWAERGRAVAATADDDHDDVTDLLSSPDMSNSLASTPPMDAHVLMKVSDRPGAQFVERLHDDNTSRGVDPSFRLPDSITDEEEAEQQPATPLSRASRSFGSGKRNSHRSPRKSPFHPGALARAISFPSPGKRRDAGADDEEARPATWRDRAASFVTRGKFRRLGAKPGVETRRPSLDSDVNRLSDGDLRT